MTTVSDVFSVVRFYVMKKLKISIKSK